MAFPLIAFVGFTTAQASILDTTPTFLVQSPSSFCDLLLAKVAADDVASAEVQETVALFNILRSIIPRLDGPATQMHTHNLDYLELEASRFGNKKALVEMLSGIDQIIQITQRSLDNLNPATSEAVRARVEREFIRLPRVFDYVRERHAQLDPCFLDILHEFFGRRLVVEIATLRNSALNLDLRHLLPDRIQVHLGADLKSSALDRVSALQLGREVTAVFGFPKPSG